MTALRLLPRLLACLALAVMFGICPGAPAFAAEGEHDAPAHGAEAAEHDGHGIDGKKLAFQLINFGILVFVLGFFGGRGINKALAARHEQIKKDLDEAAQARAAAEARLKTQEKRMANLERDVAALRVSIKDEAKKEEELLVAAAEDKARRIQDETRFLMDQQVKEAELRFRQEVASTAVRVAEEIVRRTVRPDDEARLNQSFVADVASSNGQPDKTPPPDRPRSTSEEPRF
jgi:F-type H+-transporting ATPase subunit b